MANFERDFLGTEFVWFFGIVEDRQDPLRLGRVRVRCLGWHTTDASELPTSDLPWADTIQPVDEPAGSATGLLIGTWVVGFFLDGKKAQRPAILGIFPGFGRTESELPRLGRQESGFDAPQSTTRTDKRVTGIPVYGPSGATWDEPEEPGDAEYPYVQTYWSESGFIRQVVNTPGTSRYAEYHPSGSYDEIQASGLRNVKTVDDKYEVIDGQDFLNVKGDQFITIDGNATLNILGNWNINVEGNKTESVKGNVLEVYDGNQTTSVGGNVIIQTGGSIYLNPGAALDAL